MKTNEHGSWSYPMPETTDLDTLDEVFITADIPDEAKSFLEFK